MYRGQCDIVFTGDIGFDKYMDGRWEDEKLLSEGILDFCRSADHVVANVEAAVIDAEDNGSHGVFFHNMNPAAVCVLEKMQADIWNISNNHIMDAGAEGLVSTRKIASDLGYKTIGAGINEIEASEPVYLEEAGGIGLFGVAYMTECIPAGKNEPGVFRWDDMELIAKRIAEIKQRCRWCVVVAHGGEEFADLPNPYTRDRYIRYLDLGADIVVAHHPHVPENYESFPDGKMIFYSLGNFIFDTNYQRAHPYTDTGVLLKLSFTEESFSFDAIGTRVVRGEEKITDSPLPAIFENVSAAEYELLSPISAKVFLNEQLKTMIYLEPERFSYENTELWHRYCFSTETDGYDKGAHMDLSLIVPLAEKAEEGKWQESTLEGVKEYIVNRPE